MMQIRLERGFIDLIIIFGILVCVLRSLRATSKQAVIEPLEGDLMRQVEYDMDEQGNLYAILRALAERL
jgi:hypothetical protein